MANFVIADNPTKIQFWDTDPLAVQGKQGLWDTCYINSVELPGIVFPTCEPKRKVDKKTAAALNGGNIDNIGRDIVDIILRHRIWNERQWQDWERIKKNLDPNNLSDEHQRKMSIAHPSLADVGVTLCYFHARTNWVSVDSTFNGGMKECQWKGYALYKVTAVKKENQTVKGAKQLPDKDVVDEIKNAQPPSMPSANIFASGL